MQQQQQTNKLKVSKISQTATNSPQVLPPLTLYVSPTQSHIFSPNCIFILSDNFPCIFSRLLMALLLYSPTPNYPPQVQFSLPPKNLVLYTTTYIQETLKYDCCGMFGCICILFALSSFRTFFNEFFPMLLFLSFPIQTKKAHIGFLFPKFSLHKNPHTNT